MNILLVGGSSGFMNRLIQKMKKEGHRVCLLTGNRFKDSSYNRVFESYRFSYDSESVGRVFESVAPDVTVFLGAYDANFHWSEEQRNTPAQFMKGLISLLMGFRGVGKGRFIFLSSDEVYGGDHDQDLTEKDEPRPDTAKGMALAQGEKLCESFGRMMERDIVVLRLQHLYGIPQRRTDCLALPGGPAGERPLGGRGPEAGHAVRVRRRGVHLSDGQLPGPPELALQPLLLRGDQRA